MDILVPANFLNSWIAPGGRVIYTEPESPTEKPIFVVPEVRLYTENRIEVLGIRTATSVFWVGTS